MHQANQGAWIKEEWVAKGTVLPDNHPLVKHAPALFDRLVEEKGPDDRPTVRKERRT